MQLTNNDVRQKKYETGVENKNNDFRTTDREKQVVLVLLGIGILSLLIATFFDRNVTQAVMNQNSIFGNVFQNYADQGAQVVTFVSAEVIAWYIWRRLNEHLIKYIMTGGMLLLALNQLLALLQDALSYTFSMLNNITKGIPMGVANNTAAVQNYPEMLRWSLAIISWLILSWLFANWLNKKSDVDLNYLIVVAVVGIAVVFIAQTTIGDMKTLWGRFRPYEMTTVSGQTMSEFTPWYHMNGINGHNSFPSGHTMSGWLFLYLAFFVPRDNISMQKRMVVFGLAMGILTAMSRVRIGAHWLSDVTVSSILVGLLIFAASRLIGAHFVENNDISL
ncbi:phosphatase PAP2 family protein [Leuconostoc gelidum]|uniref:phosphatase PAP2 family protein n=1 Tax=Leuconostoc gelidum TaxID=1244 RepID=UPI001C7D1358|nr:phosphatase PAP2 family protein [Leuconostoc gelidum]MBZ6009647.1 phosphatase PAP2 family protein [Leuconostoc gelidum subsp. aenigmaticum]